MKRKPVFNLILFPLLLSCTSLAQISEQERLSGFAEHQKNQILFDEARRKGERAYYEEEEQWESQKNRTLADYKKSKKQAVMSDDGPEAKADQAAKKEFLDQYEQNRRAYAKNHTRQDVLMREALNLPSEAQELGLDQKRPRYEYRKRAMFGGQPKYGKITGGGGASGGGSSRGSISPGGSSFPPPPTFDDFGGDGGYVPAPNMPEDYGDVPPPPPPPLPMGDEGGYSGEGVDFPPPPPPPPPFGDEGGF